MDKQERPAQRASLAIATLVFPITASKGQGFLHPVFLDTCLSLGATVQNMKKYQAFFPAII